MSEGLDTQPPSTRAGSDYAAHFWTYPMRVRVLPSIASTRLSLDSYPVTVNLYFSDDQLKQIGTAIAKHLGLVMVEGNERNAHE